MKLGDKDYWQVGDDVYCLNLRKFGKIQSIKDNTEAVAETSFDEAYSVLGSIYSKSKEQCLFHLGAITFDKQGRPVSINYDYAPSREPKVMVTKLPHEFVEGEEVLVRDTLFCEGESAIFSCLNHINLEYPFVASTNVCSRCVPLVGNKHCLGKTTNCESGKIPNGYVLPKKEYKFKPFDRVLVRNNKEYVWRCAIFSHYNENKEFCTTDYSWAYCVPFEGNEKLLGTTDNPED